MYLQKALVILENFSTKNSKHNNFPLNIKISRMLFTTINQFYVKFWVLVISMRISHLGQITRKKNSCDVMFVQL